MEWEVRLHNGNVTEMEIKASLLTKLLTTQLYQERTPPKKKKKTFQVSPSSKHQERAHSRCNGFAGLDLCILVVYKYFH